jgi:GNAT superfamily N-acetyltransferase
MGFSPLIAVIFAYRVRPVWNAGKVDEPPTVRIERFRPAMKDRFRQLVLDGLADHWGAVDATLNPDLADIETVYGNDVVLVAVQGDELVGTGILVVRPPAGEIVRMSVHRDHRRRGIATTLVSELCRAARARGVDHLVVETNAAWSDARAFYEKTGFAFTHHEAGSFGQEAFYAMALRP